MPSKHATIQYKEGNNPLKDFCQKREEEKCVMGNESEWPSLRPIPTSFFFFFADFIVTIVMDWSNWGNCSAVFDIDTLCCFNWFSLLSLFCVQCGWEGRVHSFAPSKDECGCCARPVLHIYNSFIHVAAVWVLVVENWQQDSLNSVRFHFSFIRHLRCWYVYSLNNV